MNSKFCDRLKEERKRLRLNQDQFAALGGVKRPAQSNYENGGRKPDSDYLEALFRGGVDTNYLLTGSRISSENGDLENDNANIFLQEKSGAYNNLELSPKVPSSVPSLVDQLTSEEHQWLEVFRKISDADKALVKPMLEGFASRNSELDQDVG